MGRTVLARLKGPVVVECKKCRAHLSLSSELMSKLFQGATGRAYLYNNAYNILLGDEEVRMMMTGLHTVSDAYCMGCKTVVGWKYIKAYVEDQRYKEEKFILEAHFIREIEQTSGRCIDNPDDKSLELGTTKKVDCERLSLGLI